MSAEYYSAFASGLISQPGSVGLLSRLFHLFPERPPGEIVAVSLSRKETWYGNWRKCKVHVPVIQVFFFLFYFIFLLFQGFVFFFLLFCFILQVIPRDCFYISLSVLFLITKKNSYFRFLFKKNKNYNFN